ncbi:MAG: PH domain-containing protein, partial [Hyphomonas sp.]
SPGGLSYLRLWPHARPLRFSKPRPVLRCLKDVAEPARVLAGAIAAFAPDRVSLSPMPARQPASSPQQLPAAAASLS